jgi:hypothetical protein
MAVETYSRQVQCGLWAIQGAPLNERWMQRSWVQSQMILWHEKWGICKCPIQIAAVHRCEFLVVRIPQICLSVIHLTKFCVGLWGICPFPEKLKFWRSRHIEWNLTEAELFSKYQTHVIYEWLREDLDYVICLVPVGYVNEIYSEH